jgi:hypothetical protein
MAIFDDPSDIILDENTGIAADCKVCDGDTPDGCNPSIGDITSPIIGQNILSVLPGCSATGNPGNTGRDKIPPTSGKVAKAIAGEHASAVAGNIGIVKAKVIIWDHDPVFARAHQKLSFPFSENTAEAIEGDLTNFDFVANAASLRPVFIPHDMFVGTINHSCSSPDCTIGTGDGWMSRYIDIVGSARSNSGKVASHRLPGGLIYEYQDVINSYGATLFGASQDFLISILPLDKFIESGISIDYNPYSGRDIFPHQLWIHSGNIFRRGVFSHPSTADRYTAAQLELFGEKYDIADIFAEATWDYTQHNVEGYISYWPTQQTNWVGASATSQSTPGTTNTTSSDGIHWSLHKFTPVWQGQDFFFSINFSEVRHDKAQIGTAHVFNIDWPEYHYLMYTKPENASSDWIEGISNEAFYIPPQKTTDQSGSTVITSEAESAARDAGRKAYWWSNKTYLLIEIGALDPNHNYFIEICEGRSPRLLHLGEEWDHPDRLSKTKLDPEGWTFIKKCRVLSIYTAVKSDELFTQGNGFRVSVQNHLGRFVITFSGKEDQPWVITRRDRIVSRETESQNSRREVVPMIVPAATLRVHGGNIKGSINITPTEYIKGADLFFPGKQADTGEATDNDIFMTFAHSGSSKYFQSTDSTHPSGRRYFDDLRFLGQTIGYDCDSYEVVEVHKNIHESINLYSNFNNQYRNYGKGWVYDVELDDKGLPQREKDEDGRDLGLLKPHTLLNGMLNAGGSPSQLKIYNTKSSSGGANFRLGLTDDDMPDYPYKDYVSLFDVGISFKAGSVAVYPARGILYTPSTSITVEGGEIVNINPTYDPTVIVLDSRAKTKVFENVITPIATSWRLIVLEGGKPFGGSVAYSEITDADPTELQPSPVFGSSGDLVPNGTGQKIKPIDISALVTKINDGWTADNYTYLNHEAKVTCYLPVGIPTGDGLGNPESDISEKEFIDALTGNSPVESYYSLGQKLRELNDKTFYVTISYWWDNGIGKRHVTSNDNSNPGGFEPEDLLIQMTGIAYGAEFEKSVNKLFMNFTVKDYMTILDKQYIFNSPFFDSVTDIVAIYEIAKMAGLDSTSKSATPYLGAIDRRPLGALEHIIINSDDASGVFRYNGEKMKSTRYDLPGSYASLADPHVKFRNGQSYLECMKQIAQYYGTKALYFDRWGVLRFENIPAVEASFRSGLRDQDVEFKPVFNFFTSPFALSGVWQGVEGFDVPDFNPCVDAASLVYNVVRYQRSVEDCVNQIVLMSASNDIQMPDGSRTGGLIVEGYTFFEQIWNPAAEGFIGFRKPFYQSNGAFGGLQQVRNALQYYSKMKYPPAQISFETYGVPGLKALDIITLDGNLYYITDIAHEIDARENRWWMNITAEWLKPFEGNLGILSEKGDTDSGANESGSKGIII